MLIGSFLFRRFASLDGRWVWVVLLAMWFAATALAQWPGQPPPVSNVDRIRLEGQLGGPQPHSTATDLTLGYQDKIYRFQLTRLRVLRGTRLYSRILANVEPYRPNFVLRGRDSEIRKIDSVRPGEPVAITGFIHESGRNVLVETIEVGSGDNGGGKLKE